MGLGSGVEVGEFVEARGRRWLVDTIVPGTPVSHKLVCVDDDALDETIELSLAAEIDWSRPSDDAWERIATTSPKEPRALGAHLRTTRWRSASAADRSLLQAPFRAGIRIDPYQLSPLSKVLGLPRANLLIADDVGLGKTVEAGLIVRELLLRKRIDTVVVVAPASMLVQWQDEMAQKFGLAFTIVDHEHLLETRRSRGFGANPWSLGSQFILSHAVLANEAYAAPLRQWLGKFRANSMLILDEAHHAAPSAGARYATESQMTRAVRDLAARFEHRLFLSATPHNGHSNAFAALLEMLDPIRFIRGIPVEPAMLEPVMVRRLKEDLRQLGEPFPRREVERLSINGLSADAPELLLPRMLTDHWAETVAGKGDRLLLGILQQRLFSSLPAFARTLRAHRRGLVEDDEPVVSDPDSIERDDDANVLVKTRKLRTVADPAARRRIDNMLAIAETNAHLPDGRIARILAWIEAEMLDGSLWRDRRLIVFTEWEDTRRWLVERLTEGLEERGVDVEDRFLVFSGETSRERRESIKDAFNGDFAAHPVRILVCTDAAREGINLQKRCHDLVHFDLPWNPSRLEQRNGRIDRKLQPAPVVTCSYFSYEQREEDRVLDALMRKTKTINKELGPAGAILHERNERRLASGIGRGEAKALVEQIAGDDTPLTQTARTELGLDDARLERLRAEEKRLAELRDRSRERVGVAPENLEHVVRLSLARLGARPGEVITNAGPAMTLDPADPAFSDPSWQMLLDELRPGRSAPGESVARWRADNPPRALVFAPPEVSEGERLPDDIVQLHLEHRLVRRLISGFVAQGFADRLDRVAAVAASGSVPRGALMTRLALYGPGARRLHEEIIPVTARWREADRTTRPLEPFGETGEATTLVELQAALREGAVPPDDVVERLSATVARDVVDLRAHAEARAAEARESAAAGLAETGEAEARQLAELIRGQLSRIEAEEKVFEPLQSSFDLRSDEERRDEEREMRQQLADRSSWEEKVEQLHNDLEHEPKRVRDGYEVIAHRLDPIGLVYLWPRERSAKGDAA